MGKKKLVKTVRVTVRFSAKDFGKVKTLASVYAGGNIASWVRHAALEAERRYLK